VDGDYFLRLVEQRMLELAMTQSSHSTASQHQSTSQSGLLYPSPSLLQSIRRTSAPAALVGHGTRFWAGDSSSQRSYSRSSADSTSADADQASSSGLESLTSSQFADPVTLAAISKTWLLPGAQFNSVIPLAARFAPNASYSWNR